MNKLKYNCYSGRSDYLCIYEVSAKHPCVIIGEDSNGHKFQDQLCQIMNEQQIRLPEIRYTTNEVLNEEERDGSKS